MLAAHRRVYRQVTSPHRSSRSSPLSVSPNLNRYNPNNPRLRPCARVTYFRNLQIRTIRFPIIVACPILSVALFASGVAEASNEALNLDSSTWPVDINLPDLVVV